MANSISASGSGLDIPTLVSQLVSAARTPTEKRINTAGTTANAKLSAIGQIKSAMTTLQGALEKMSAGADAPSFKATVPSAAGFTASATSKAVAGDYSVEVVRLATAQKLSSAAYAKDAKVGSGTLSIAWGAGKDDSVKVTLGTGATLTDIAAAVNAAAGGKGVTASVVTADDGQHLVFSATATGSAATLAIGASGGDGGLVALTNGAGGGLTQTVAATDALVRVDGFERTSSSNTVSDLVPGVSLALTKAAPGSSYTLNIAGDNSGLKSTITAYVSAYNSVMGTLKATSAYNSTTRTASALTGDSLVRTLQQTLRGQVSANVTGLKDLGIAVDKNGVMSFDAAAFDEAVAADPESVKRLLGKEGLYGASVDKLLDGHLDSIDGTLVLRTESINKQISGLEDQLDKLDARMSKLSDMYTAQFTAMETMIVQMQGSASSLNNLLSSSD
ncbi:flagellar filament capping protein FliD [Pseudoxanthomonas sp. 10H]|uniref:flagellar filament capping protein FliD n=1 Tax=Pseudoxanthomonas sp. 10H TaxID=3242729 RepID=UPI0035569E73